ncbi:Dam family site-specific DNA-(adenine-N6)-methyltransferase [Sneathiella sp.]|uniref:DNA adenine methylase n=1 Tax=Sneathiella sp. TaxID=1964365 RepID=UPI00260A71DF|nr:Dam family site-specific DNA-(adenine-N6)-methyltransferase [Sneathiella sp.]MDF2369089.1 Dam family site-specific DNA-(adenine-N6)-methyltransferase [Sneathiella sp.]
MKPFIKWAGGKRWLVESNHLNLPKYSGRYIEPFLGGGAMFFHISPKEAILSDVNPRLINAYRAVRDNWQAVESELRKMQRLHSTHYYYEERNRLRKTPHTSAAQFLYLNRTCWNGLYRENLSGKFNVPIGTKTQVIMPDDDFKSASSILNNAIISVCDFEETMAAAMKNDLVFLDPPYTTAHNTNGFIKYNQNIFSWKDQIRLRDCVEDAYCRGAKIVMTNANHQTIWDLYSGLGTPKVIARSSVISAKSSSRGQTTEALFVF